MKRIGLCLSVILPALLLFLPGCQNEDAIDQLRQENPFKSQEQNNLNSIVVTTCNYMILELPGNVKIADQSFWSPHELAPGRAAPNGAITAGFGLDQTKMWRDNGLSLALAPMSMWKTFVDGLTRLGAQTSPEKMAVFKNPRQVVDLQGYWLDQPQSVFLSDAQGSLRGYTLASGECLLRINCMPYSSVTSDRSTFMKIIPIFRNAQSQFLASENKLGFTEERPQIVFDQLNLSGTLRNGFFLAITARPADGKIGHLGQLFLSRSFGADNYQLVILLAPRSQAAAEMKAG